MDENDHIGMDRPRVESQWHRYRAYLFVGLGLVGVLIFVVGFQLWRINAETVDVRDFIIASVQRGELAVTVEGVGVLEPILQHRITSGSNGTVLRVLVQPGQNLQAGDPIAELSNPIVLQSLDSAKISAAGAEQAHLAELARLRSQLLTHESSVLRARTDHKEILLQLEAEEELLEKGAMRGIDYERTKLREELYGSVLQQQEALLENHREASSAAEKASESRLENAQLALKQSQENVHALTIRSETDGVLTELILEEGSHVTRGSSIGTVADTSEMVGSVRVPASRAGEVAIGQEAVVRVVSQDVSAEVRDIAPAVEDGTVEIQLQFTNVLPQGARPDLAVRATITIVEYEEVLYVARPPRVMDRSVAQIYRVDESGSTAAATRVEFGLGTVRDVEIIDGLNQGDKILLGVPEHYEDRQVIRFSN